MRFDSSQYQSTESTDGKRVNRLRSQGYNHSIEKIRERKIDLRVLEINRQFYFYRKEIYLLKRSRKNSYM